MHRNISEELVSLKETPVQLAITHFIFIFNVIFNSTFYVHCTQYLRITKKCLE